MKTAALLEDKLLLDVPSSKMISSFTSYQKLQLRGGVAVGGQSLQDMIDFHDNHRIQDQSDDNEACSICLELDVDRDEPFFVLLLTTKKLLSQFDLEKTIETDETFKIMHEGYPLTLIGQGDANRKFHIR